MVTSPGDRRISWLFFKAVRAGLAVKRPYLDSYGSSESGGGRIGYIEFEIAKTALEQGQQDESKQFATCSVASRLPNLAADDWLDWTALGALFGAVTLIPVLSMLLFR